MRQRGMAGRTGEPPRFLQGLPPRLPELPDEPCAITEHLLVRDANQRDARPPERAFLEEIPASLGRRAVIAAVDLDREAHLGPRSTARRRPIRAGTDRRAGPRSARSGSPR